MIKGPQTPCPHCYNDQFVDTTLDSNPAAILLSAKIEADGSYTPDYSKVMGVTPYICSNCGYVMLFRN